MLLNGNIYHDYGGFIPAVGKEYGQRMGSKSIMMNCGVIKITRTHTFLSNPHPLISLYVFQLYNFIV